MPTAELKNGRYFLTINDANNTSALTPHSAGRFVFQMGNGRFLL